MTENVWRGVLGILLVLLHLGVVGLIFITYLRGGFRFDEFTTSLAIIIPMFAGYTTAVVKHLTTNRFRVADESPEITVTFAAMSAMFPILLALALGVAVVLFGSGRVFGDFEEFKATLVILETVFAVHVAQFVYTLFERTNARTSDGPPTAPKVPTASGTS